jgi:hypothetical protein
MFGDSFAWEGGGGVGGDLGHRVAVVVTRRPQPEHRFPRCKFFQPYSAFREVSILDYVHRLHSESTHVTKVKTVFSASTIRFGIRE